MVAAALPAAAQGSLPWVVRLAVTPGLRAGQPGELRLTYRAPAADVVAVLQAVDDLEGPPAGRLTGEREIGVVARAYGYERGELVLPLAFATPGRKRVTVTLVTEARELSDPATVEVEVLP